MLCRAYEYYRNNRREIESRTDVSAHRQVNKPLRYNQIRLMRDLLRQGAST